MRPKATHNAKGNLGERIVADYLAASENWRAYGPLDESKRHPCDFLLIRDGDGAKRWIDVKAYAAVELHGFLMTGVNLHHYNEYCNIRRTQDEEVWLYFLDHEYGKAYGQRLSKLIRYLPETNVVGKQQHFPWIMATRSNGTKMMWPLSRLVELFALSYEQCAALRELTKYRPQSQDPLFD